LTDAQRAGRIPPLVALFPGPKPVTEQVYGAAAFSFVAFLLGLGGPERFKQFVNLLQPGHGPAAVQTVYGRSMGALEQAWHRTLGRARTGGIVRFLRLVRPYLAPYRLKVAEIILYIVMAVAFSIGFARAQGILLDKALIPRNTHVLGVTMVILILAFAVVIVGQARASYVVAVVSGGVLRELRLRMFGLVQRLEPGAFRSMPTGDILARMTTDVDQVQIGMPIVLAQGLRLILTVVAAVIAIFLLNWKMAFLALVAIPLLALTGRVFAPRAAEASMQRQQKLALAVSTLQENLAAQTVVKAFSLEGWAGRRYAVDLAEVFRAGVSMTFITGLSGATFASIASLVQLTVLGLGGYLVVQGQLTAGILFAFLALMAQVVGPMQNLTSVLQSIQQASGGMERVHQFLLTKPAIADADGARDLGRLAHGISLTDVSFSYTGAEPNLQAVSFDIPAGASVALVGPSGCGKSTILNLIMRFYDPTAGRVCFDGVDLRTATLESIRGQIGIVLQDSVLFNMTIRENIRLGDLTVTDDEVEAAAHTAEIHDAIIRMPLGYDTEVGEGGKQLSGGQRQRVAVARAVVRNPAILLLDEATSALDPRTEAAVAATLERIGQGRTTITVSHRLASITGSHRIIVLDAGMVVEQGTHAELLDHAGLYASLWHEQMSVVATGMSASEVDALRLRRVPLFATLPPTLLASLAEQLHLERHSAGDIIIEQGTVGDKMYIIRRGQVAVLAANPAGVQRRLAVLEEGDHFGEIALLHDAPRMATIRARTAVELQVLDKEDFAALLAAEPESRATMERIMVEREQKTASAAGAASDH
ncbi:MAG: ABC transporter transmembrane domain-containing protein, partial [Chloroflexota bacterium]|nr:ABC transporter transmembrane domain-containing protein [Chloroflexota bacterium]